MAKKEKIAAAKYQQQETTVISINNELESVKKEDTIKVDQLEDDELDDQSPRWIVFICRRFVFIAGIFLIYLAFNPNTNESSGINVFSQKIFSFPLRADGNASNHQSKQIDTFQDVDDESGEDSDSESSFKEVVNDDEEQSVFDEKDVEFVHIPK